MAINYNPEDANKNLWPEGDYDAVLMRVDDKVSQSGNDMEVWQIGCYHPDGREQTIKEYVTAAAAFKIKGLALAMGCKAEFEAGEFHAEDHIGSGFSVYLKVEEGDGDYPDKNKIAKYKPKAKPAQRQPVAPPPRNIGEGVRQKIASKSAPKQPFDDDVEFKDSEIPF